MKVVRFKGLDLNNSYETLKNDEVDLLINAYLETSQFVLNSGRSERIRIADLLDLMNSFKENTDKGSISKIEAEIADLRLINGNYSRIVEIG